MKEKRDLLVIFLCCIITLALVYWFRTEWRKKLSSKDGRITVAHVYSSSEIKGSRFYKYIYKVDNNFYSTSSSGTNVNHRGDSLNLQPFLVCYYQPDPKIHIVIWSNKISPEVPLGIHLDSMNIDKDLIRRNTSFWTGTSPTADKNNERDLMEYNQLTGSSIK